eukprot:gene7738-7800_t
MSRLKELTERISILSFIFMFVSLLWFFGMFMGSAVSFWAQVVFLRCAAVAVPQFCDDISRRIGFSNFLAAATATSNPVILTVSGLVGDGTPVKFDRAALEALGMDSFETTTPWHTGKVKFEGVLMSTLLASVHAHGTTVFAKALDDYFSEIPVEDFTKYKVILALKRDGAYMPVSDQGPLFVIYPFDSDPILKDAKFQSRSVWQGLWTRIIIIAATTFLVVAVMFVSALVNDRETQLTQNSALRLGVGYDASQALNGLTRALRAIGRLQLEPSDEHFEQATLRLQIFKGVAGMFQRGQLHSFILRKQQRQDFAKRLLSVTEKLDEQIADLANPQVQEAITLELEPLEPEMTGIVAEINNNGFEEISDEHRGLISSLEHFSIAAVFVIFCCLLLAIVMFRQVRALEAKDGLLQIQNLHFNTALNNMTQGLTLFDAEDHLVIANARFSALYGLDPQQIKSGLHFIDIAALTRQNARPVLKMNTELSPVFEKTRQLALNNAYAQEQLDGRVLWISHEPMVNGGWVTTYEDITDRRRNEEKISFMALHDSLTGLANRPHFREKLRLSLDGLEGAVHAGFALYLIDLDDFKSVNDLYGHLAGDEILCEVARRLQSCAQPDDLVARLGGDEFAIIQSDIEGRDEAWSLATQIIGVMKAPFHLEAGTVSGGVSIGVSLAPLHGHQDNLLIKRADLALYRAKAEGKGHFALFEEGMDIEIERKRALEYDLQHAIQRGELPSYKIAVNLSPIQIKNSNLVQVVMNALASSALPADRLELEITESAFLQDSEQILTTLRHRCLNVMSGDLHNKIPARIPESWAGRVDCKIDAGESSHERPYLPQG